MGCRFLLEQPGGSVACLHERLQKLFEQLMIFQTTIWGGAYATDPGVATPKRHILYSNDKRLLTELSTAAGHLSREQLDAFGGQIVKRQKTKAGGDSWTGIKDAMSQSQLGTQFLFFSHLDCVFVSLAACDRIAF